MISHDTTDCSNLSDESSHWQGSVMSELEQSVILHKETCVDRSPILDRVTIDTLHDDVLLDIFDFYKDDRANRKNFAWRWIILIQVCRRWRHLIFESPRRLDLRVVCSPTTPTRGLLDFWPHLPIIVCCRSNRSYHSKTRDVDNLMTALEYRDRTSQICISGVHDYSLQGLIDVMNKPFPILTKLSLDNVGVSRFNLSTVPPKTFLGGSAPSLRSLSLAAVHFPTFPQFILSSPHIVHLSLTDVGDFSPDVMVSCLAALPKLNYFRIGSGYPQSHTVQQSVSPSARAVLPALTQFSFRGMSEYFEALFAQIDTPILKRLSITFIISALEIPRIHDFVNRIENLGPFVRADMAVFNSVIRMTLGSPTSTQFQLALKYDMYDWIMSSMTQIFSQQLHLLSHVEQLEIRGPPVIDSSLCLGLFSLFAAVKSLYVTDMLVDTVAAALKELALERTMEVFPVLGNLYLEGPQSSVPESMGSFVASRQLSGHPLVIENWKRKRQLTLYDEMDDS